MKQLLKNRSKLEIITCFSLSCSQKSCSVVLRNGWTNSAWFIYFGVSWDKLSAWEISAQLVSLSQGLAKFNASEKGLILRSQRQAYLSAMLLVYYRKRLYILTGFFNVSDSLSIYCSTKMQWCFRLSKLQNFARRLLWRSHGIHMIFLPIQLMKISITSGDLEMKLWYRNGLTENQPGNVCACFCLILIIIIVSATQGKIKLFMFHPRFPYFYKFCWKK